MAEGKKKYESVGEAFGVAAKAFVPELSGFAGAVIGGVGLRWLAARYLPEDYRTKTWLPYALGAGGALIGAAASTIPLVDYKTKSGREKGWKATIPLVTLGAGVGLGLISFGPRLVNWFRTAYPNVSAAMNPGGTMYLPPQMQPQAPAPAPQLPAQMTSTPQLTLGPRQQMMFKAGGLSPAQWRQLEQRAAGLTRGGTASSARWAD